MARWPLSAAARWTVSTSCSRPSARPPSAPMAARFAASTAQVARTAPLPDSVREIFTGLADNIPGLLLEDKKCALALHYRLAPEALPVLTAAMEKHARLFEAEKVHILHGKAVIEARPLGIDKGSAVAQAGAAKALRGPRHPVRRRRHHRPGCLSHPAPAGRARLFGGQAFPRRRTCLSTSPRAVRQWLVQAGGRRVCA